MANLILKNVYKTNVDLVESPQFKSVEYVGNKAILTYNFAEGLYFKTKKSDLFEIAGKDGKYFPATAKIINQKIILEAKEVKNPENVRYSWNNEAIPDLFNKANLPASSFTTEN